MPGCSGLFKYPGCKDTDNKISWPLKRDFGHQEVFLTHNAESVTLRPWTVCDNKRAREQLGDQTLLVWRTWGNILLLYRTGRTSKFKASDCSRKSHWEKTFPFASICEATGWNGVSGNEICENPVSFSSIWAGKLISSVWETLKK